MGARDDQLGMSFGTARYRLQRMLLFAYVQHANEDWCFRCGEEIEVLEDFTIEHKEPWLHVSADLFWDLTNIAFSHVKCNQMAARNGSWRLRKIGPPGTAWCVGHKSFLPAAVFTADARRFSGLHKYCRDCRRRGGVAYSNGARSAA